jgi:glutamine amidotransferase
MDAPTDSALLWLLTLELLEAGAGLGEALAEVAAAAIRGPGGRVNLLVTDGTAIAATVAGASLSFRVRPGGVVVASEPDDDEPGWQDVGEGQLLIATRDSVTVTAI